LYEAKCNYFLLKEKTTGLKDIPLSNRLRAGFIVNTDLEYMAEQKYVITKKHWHPRADLVEACL